MSDKISVVSAPTSLHPNELDEESELGEEKTSQPATNTVNYWNLLYIFVIVIGCAIVTCIVTLIPRHNTIFYPEYWYEPMIVFTFTIGLRLTFATILELWSTYPYRTCKSKYCPFRTPLKLRVLGPPK